MFSLVRVDDRLVHGQVVMYWTKVRKGDGIILVMDDEMYKDDFIKTVFKSTGKQLGLRVLIFNFEQALRKVPEAMASDKQYYLITKSISMLRRLKEAGIDFGNEIICGNTSNRPDTKRMYNNVYFTDQEIEDGKYLRDQGIDIEFQLTPNDTQLAFDKAL